MPHPNCAIDSVTAIDLILREEPADKPPCRGCGQALPPQGECSHCVSCIRCRATVTLEQTVATTRGSTICEHCRDGYWLCGSCEGWNRDGDYCGNGCCDPDECHCEECTGETDDEFARLVHEYGYKPFPVFHGDGPLYLGPEIEIETPLWAGEECAQIAQSHLGDLGYMKADSSLSSGFEIVTHPMSYEWAMENFPWRMLTDLRESGCDTNDTTGIHVHLSRAGFSSAAHIYRWMKFIYRNQQHVITLARRSSTEWAAFTDHDRRAVKDYAKGARGGRHCAINPNNRDTFELRVFASSLDPTEVKAALGLADASVEYTRALTVPDIVAGAWTWSAFAAWLTDRPAYAPLFEQMEALQCAC